MFIRTATKIIVDMKLKMSRPRWTFKTLETLE